MLFGLVVSAFADNRTRFGLNAWVAILYFEIVSGLALRIRWVAIVTWQPGIGLNISLECAAAATSLTLSQLQVRSAPESGVPAMANNDMLPMLFFTLFDISARRQPHMALFAESICAFSQRYVKYIMYVAIPGMTDVIALAARAPLAEFLRCRNPALLLTVTTTSSAAALPKAIKGMERFGIPRNFVGFVMPLGLSCNLRGSSIQLMMAILITAQAVVRPMSLEFVLSVW